MSAPVTGSARLRFACALAMVVALAGGLTVWGVGDTAGWWA